MLAPEIGQCPAKNRFMFDESCFATDRDVRREVKNFLSHRRLKTHRHSISIQRSSSGFSFYEHINRQFTHTVFLYLKPQDVFE